MRKLLLSLILLVALPLGAARGFGSGEGSGTTDRIAYANYAAINDLNTLTYALWTYRTGNGGGNNGRIVDKRNANASGGAFLYTTATNYAFEQHRWSGGKGAWHETRPAGNVWVHVAITYDAGSTANDPTFYFDGVSQGAPVEDVTPSGTLAAETEILHVGNSGATTRVWDGRLCEVAIWNRVLSPSEVASLGDGFSPLFFPRGLVLYSTAVRDILNRLAGSTITTTGTAVLVHPRIIYPTQPISGFAAAGAPPARDLMIISKVMKYAPAPILAGGLGLAWGINRRNKLMRGNKEELE